MQQKRESRKRFSCKYQNQITLTGGAPKFVPLVFEHFGNWGNEADKFLNDLSKKSVDAEGRLNNTALETDGEGVFQFYYRNVIVQSF